MPKAPTRQAQMPNIPLAKALKRAKGASADGILKSADLSRSDRERLQKAGWIHEIIKGWYLLRTPEGNLGDSTGWFIGFWPFVKHFLKEKLGGKYCLSADCSLDLHAEEDVISPQIVVLTTKPVNQTIQLPHNTSLLIYKYQRGLPKQIVEKTGIRVMSLELALCRLSATYYEKKSLNVEIALKLLTDPSSLSKLLVENGLVTSASRIAGAHDAMGDYLKRDRIVQDMASGGFTVRVTHPFKTQKPWLSSISRFSSPYSGRIQAMWAQMRPDVIDNFPKTKRSGKTLESEIRAIKELYTEDAYNSLSIEGYQVSEELIEKVASGNWNPANIEEDRKQRDALVVKGYQTAFESVLKSVSKTLKGQNPGTVLEHDLQTWYQQLFSPLAQINMIATGDLIGYRNRPVYIKGSKHVPPSKDALPDVMETFFQLIKNETDARVRAVLGHFIFVFTHPYFDGNGRIGRFLMNLMLVSGGYNWTVIRTAKRDSYMSSLEEACVRQDIVPFTKFVASEMQFWKKRSRP